VENRRFTGEIENRRLKIEDRRSKIKNQKSKIKNQKSKIKDWILVTGNYGVKDGIGMEWWKNAMNEK